MSRTPEQAAAVWALQEAGVDLHRANQARAAAADALARAVRDAVGCGAVSQVEAARIGGVDRMTVRRYLGKGSVRR